MLESPPPRRELEPDPLPLALRAATLGLIFACLLGLLLVRLWALQILHADQYAQAASQNIRHSVLPAQRGLILDSSGKVMVNQQRRDLGADQPGPAAPAGRLCGHRAGSVQAQARAGLRGAEAAGRRAADAVQRAGGHRPPVLPRPDDEPGLPDGAQGHRDQARGRVRHRADDALQGRRVRVELPAPVHARGNRFPEHPGQCRCDHRREPQVAAVQERRAAAHRHGGPDRARDDLRQVAARHRRQRGPGVRRGQASRWAAPICRRPRCRARRSS